MKITWRRPQRRALRTFTTALVLTALAALLLAGTALAVAKPGRPTARAPKSTVTATKPTFTWSKAARATNYELRVYQGTRVVLKKTGLTKLSWKSSKALPTNVNLAWKVRAGNAGGNGAWSRSLTFKVVPSSPGKVITVFSFASPAATGVINETLHTITFTVPFGTDVSALVPTIAFTGTSVSPASGAAHDFSGPVTYTVTAADATTQPYVVTVTVAANPAKAITAFTVPGQTGATVINETLKTVALTVPSGTDVTALVPTITITGTSVNPASGVPRDFTSAATYTVNAADATTQPYIVTVTMAVPLAIGDWYQGGYVAYILMDGDPGYIGGQTHGLIAAKNDQDETEDGIIWTLPAFAWTSVPGTSTAIGTGAANTEAIISQNGAGITYAAGLAQAYTIGVFSDWYLPSRDELDKLYLNQAKIGQFDNTSGTFYWSSSEYDSDSAYGQYFMNGSFQSFLYKEYAKGWVRAVRTF